MLPFALISLSGNSSEEEVFEFVTESSENTSDTTRIIMNSTKGFDIIQYSIFKQQDQELSAFPDTSFTIDSNTSAAIMAGMVINYDLAKSSFGKLGIIKSYQNASDLKFSEFNFNEVKVMHVTFADDKVRN